MAGESARWRQARPPAQTRSRHATAASNARGLRSQSPAGKERDNSTGHRLETCPRKADRAHHAGKYHRCRKTTNRFHQIPVCLLIVRNGAPKERNEIERVEVVKGG